MKRTRYGEEQIIHCPAGDLPGRSDESGILAEHKAGAKRAALCRKHGMSDATLYKWKVKYGGMTVSKLRRLKNLETENAELKRLLADAMLDNAGLKGLLAKDS